MNRFMAGTLWILLYLVVVLAPLFLMMVSPTPPGRSFWVEFSVALGFVGLTQIGVQFVLIARYRKAQCRTVSTSSYSTTARSP